MTIPFTQYLDVKDKYCLSYFGDDKDILTNVLAARDYIEQDLKGIKVFIACKDSLHNVVQGARNIILESKMADYRGKMAHTCNLEKLEDIKLLLVNSKINS